MRAHSLGLLELGSAPALPEAVELAARLGLDLSGHRARHLAHADLANADLVVGFEQIHVSASVVDGEAPFERTFTLPKLVSLLGALDEQPSGEKPVDRARARIAQAHALRASEPPNRPVPEIADPLGRPRAAQRRTAEQIQALVAELRERLFR